MKEKTNWDKFVAWCRKAWRVVWHKYNREIKAFVKNHVDNAFVELGRHVDSAVQKQIKNEIIKKAIRNKVDIYTSTGAHWVQNEIEEYIEMLGGGE